MALTTANVDSRSEDTWGRQRVRVIEVTFPNPYTVGGESLTPADVGLAEITFVAVSPDSDPTGGYVIQYDYTAQTLQVFIEEAVAAGGPLLEAGAIDLSAVKARVLVVGR